jgi:hypothetical protein
VRPTKVLGCWRSPRHEKSETDGLALPADKRKTPANVGNDRCIQGFAVPAGLPDVPGPVIPGPTAFGIEGPDHASRASKKDPAAAALARQLSHAQSQRKRFTAPRASVIASCFFSSCFTTARPAVIVSSNCQTKPSASIWSSCLPRKAQQLRPKVRVPRRALRHVTTA